jgi:putative protease
VKNKFSVGDTLELELPEGNIELETLINKTGETITVAPGSGHKVKIPDLGPVPKRGLVAKYL